LDFGGGGRGEEEEILESAGERKIRRGFRVNMEEPSRGRVR
jgi:hypothetical protein